MIQVEECDGYAPISEEKPYICFFCGNPIWMHSIEQINPDIEDYNEEERKKEIEFIEKMKMGYKGTYENDEKLE